MYCCYFCFHLLQFKLPTFIHMLFCVQNCYAHNVEKKSPKKGMTQFAEQNSKLCHPQLYMNKYAIKFSCTFTNDNVSSCYNVNTKCL